MPSTSRLVLVLLLILFFGLASQTASAQTSPCPLQGGARTVTICRPLTSVNYSSPIRVLAAAARTQTQMVMRIYLDGVKVYAIASDALDTNILVSTGTHELIVRAVDTAGSFQKTM